MGGRNTSSSKSIPTLCQYLNYTDAAVLGGESKMKDTHESGCLPSLPTAFPRSWRYSSRLGAKIICLSISSIIENLTSPQTLKLNRQTEQANMKPIHLVAPDTDLFTFLNQHFKTDRWMPGSRLRCPWCPQGGAIG